MKNTIIIQSAFAIVSVIALTATAVCAHSSHNHSNLPLKWNFSDEAKAKVKSKMSSSNWSSSVGLSKLDQKILQNYGINIGNIFSTTMDGKSLTVKRTSLGLRVMDVEGLTDMTYVPEIPVRNLGSISRISTNAVHSGHDHKILNKEWTFSSKTESKIARRIQGQSYPVFVGLTSIERKAMEAYGIRNGNVFKTQVAGQDLLVKRSSGGMKIDMNSVEVASLDQAGAM